MYFIDRLWEGEITPSEKFIKKGSELHKVYAKLSKEEDFLRRNMDEDEKRHFEEFSELEAEAADITNKETFIYAFKLGAGVVLDLLDNSERQLGFSHEE